MTLQTGTTLDLTGTNVQFSSCTSNNYTMLFTPGVHYWNVLAFGSKASDEVISIQTFSFCVSSLPTSMNLLYPPPSSSIVTTSPVVSWSPLTNFGVSCSATPNTYSLSYSTFPNLSPASSVSTIFLDGEKTSFTLVGLSLTTWYWQLTASNGNFSSISSIWSFSVCSPNSMTGNPNPISPATGATVTVSSASLSWSSTSFGSSTCGVISPSYLIYLDTANPYPLNFIAEVPSTITSFSVSSFVQTGYNYYWRIVAANSGGLQLNGAVGNFTVCTSTSPSPVSIVYPTNNLYVTSASTTFSWDAPLSAGSYCGGSLVVTYAVALGAVGGGGPYINICSGLSASTTSCTYTLPSAGLYNWYVVTSNGVLSSYSANYTVNYCNPESPSDITLASLIFPASGASNVPSTSTFTWTSSAFSATNTACGLPQLFVIYIYSNSNQNHTVGTVHYSSSTSSYSFTPSPAVSSTLIQGVAYFWRVSSFSSPLLFTSGQTASFTVCDVTPPSDFYISTPSASDSVVLDGAISLNWTNVESWGQTCGASSSTSSFDIYISANGDFNYVSTPIVSVSSSIYSIYNFSVEAYINSHGGPGAYYIQVVAVNDAGASSYSQVLMILFESVCDTDVAPLSTLPDFPASNGFILSTSTTIDFSWDAFAFGVPCSGPEDDTLSVSVVFGNGGVTNYNNIYPYNTSITYTSASNLPLGVATWSITANNGVLQTISSFTFCVISAPPAPTLINPPSGISVLNDITLNWQGLFGDESCQSSSPYRVYRVYLCTSSAAPSNCLVATTTSTSYVPSGLIASTTYFWRVETDNGYASTSSSSTFMLDVCQSQPPTLPSSLIYPSNSASNVASTVTFSWSSSSSFGTTCASQNDQYTVYVGTVISNLSVVGTVPSSSTSYQLTAGQALPPGLYYWAVSASNGETSSLGTTTPNYFFVCSSVAPSVTNMYPPNNGVLLPDTALTWNIQWGDACNSASHTLYIQFSQTGVGGGFYSYLLPEFATSFTPTSFTIGNGNPWNWQLSMFIGTTPTNTTWSSFNWCSPSNPTTAPTVVSPSLSSTISSYPYPTITWNKITGGQWGTSCNVASNSVYYYNIYLSQSSTPSFFAAVVADTSSSTTQSYNLTGTLFGGTYYVKIQAWNGMTNPNTGFNGLSPPSSVVSFTVCVATMPDNPIVVLPLSGSFLEATNIQLAWSNSTGFGLSCGVPVGNNNQPAYQLLLDSYQPPQTVIDSYPLSSGKTSIVTSVNIGSIYWFRIRAVSPTGLCSVSQSVVLAICKDQPPSAPIAIRVGNSNNPATIQPARPTIYWDLVQNYGVVCLFDILPSVSLLISTTHSNLTAADQVNPSPLARNEAFYSLTASEELPTNTTVYYAVMSSNGVLNSISNVQSFTTGLLNCASLNCNQKASTCDSTVLNPACVCSTGWQGPTCSKPICNPQDCNGRGTCTGPNLCTCTDTSYTGNLCDISVPTKSNNSQSIMIGIIVAIVITILIIVAYCYIRKLRSQERTFKTLSMPDLIPLAFLPPKTSTESKEGDDAWRTLESALLPDKDGNFYIALALGECMAVTEMEELCKSLVYIYYKHNCCLQFMKYLITKEVQNSAEEGTLFRANGLTSKVFKFYSKVVGLEYLFKTLGLLINEILEVAQTEQEKEENYKKKLEMSDNSSGGGISKDTKSKNRQSSGTAIALLEIDTKSENLFSGDIEIDPSKMKGDQDAFTNMLALQLLVQKILIQVKRSSSRVPLEFREIFRHLAMELRKKYPAAVTSTIGGFLFLRFINPAILLPEAYGLSPNPPLESARRQLVLVTKVIQNLSNGVLFGKKEEFMVSVNPFIEQNQKSFNDFLDELAVLIPNAVNDSTPLVLPNNIYNSALGCVYTSAKSAKGVDQCLKTNLRANEAARDYSEAISLLDAKYN